MKLRGYFLAGLGLVSVVAMGISRLRTSWPKEARASASRMDEDQGGTAAEKSFLDIAQELVAYAYRHDIPVNSELIVALDESTEKLADRKPHREVMIAEQTRALIAQLDERLGSNDAEFTRLFTNFKAAEHELRNQAAD